MKGRPEDNFTVTNIFQDSVFYIPEYQRDYSWDSKNIQDFIEDIEFVLHNVLNEDSDDTTHYFGTVVLEGNDYEKADARTQLERYRVIDGQQRLTTTAILMRSIANELSFLSNIDTLSEELSDKIRETKRDIVKKYIKHGDVCKLTHKGLTKDGYEDVVIENRTPKQQFSSIKRIVDAKSHFDDWFSKSKSELFDIESDPSNQEYTEYFNYLQSILNVVEHKFEVSINTVEDEDEAARMFKVINGRGKELKLIDKVQSHIVYCASRNQKLDTEDLYNQFNDIHRNITSNFELSDEDVDKLVKFHWIVFTGEIPSARTKDSGPSSIHHRIEMLDEYAQVRRENLEVFVQAYVDSLQEFSVYYPEIISPSVYKDTYNLENGINREILNRLQSLNQYSSGLTAFTPVLLAYVTKYEPNTKEFLELVSRMEAFVFRYNVIMRRGCQYRSKFDRFANRLYWSERDKSDYVRVFGTDSGWDKVFDNIDSGISEVLSEIEARQSHKASDELIAEYLNKRDVINADGIQGWGGIRHMNHIRFLLYEYERSLRSSESSDMRTFDYWSDKYEVEHIVPVKAPDGHRLAYHDKNVHRLGNLALISPQENRSVSNSPYCVKQSKMYKNSPLHMLRELPEDEFELQDVKDRSEKLIEFVLDRW